jgi:16S rRNA (uracil1498-N3)-methyltransferase
LPDRFYHPPPLALGPATLDGPEVHHLIHVFRAKPGLEVTLFDGGGAEFLARVEKVQRMAVQLTVLNREEIDRELPARVTLAVSLPKGDRQRWLIEKATELGAARILPLITERSVAQPTAEAIGRLERAVIEASKQCGRNRLMEIAAPTSWPQLATTSRDKPLQPRLIAHPGGASLAHRQTIAESCTIAIGPEGGFTDGEMRLAIDGGWQSVDLGRRVLRVETAAIALLAAVALGRVASEPRP